MNITGSWIYEKAFFKYQSHTNLCKSPSPGIARQSTQKKPWDSQNLIKSREVSWTSEIKNTMLREVGRPRGQNIQLMTNTRSEFHELSFSKSQSNTLLWKSPNSDRARQYTRSKAWYSQNLTKIRSVSLLGIKNTKLTGSRIDPLNIQVQNSN